MAIGLEYNYLFVKSRYFHDEYNLQGDLTCGRFIDGDCGVRADLTRHFGGLSVGGFAMVSGGRFNGGFHFEVPLFFKKRNRRKSVELFLHVTSIGNITQELSL